MRAVRLLATAGLVLGLMICALMLHGADASTKLGSEPHTMVVLDDNMIKTTHSIFFNTLQRTLISAVLLLLLSLCALDSECRLSCMRSSQPPPFVSFLSTLNLGWGHKLDFINVKEEALVLSLHGKWLADNLIIFAPTALDMGEFMRPKDIMDFVDAGNSLLMVGDWRLSEQLRELANGYGVDFDEDSSVLVDGENDMTSLPEVAKIFSQTTPGSVGQLLTAHDASVLSIKVPCDKNTPTEIIGSCNTERQLYYSGIGSLIPEGSRFIRSVISGNPTTVSVDKGTMTSASTTTTLVSAMQSLINARAVFSGSLAMFSDSFFSLPNSANREIVTALARWVFHESGFIRVREATHRMVDNSTNPHGYKLGDEIVYEAILESYDGAKREWVPYVSDKVLFELVMVDPFYRHQFQHVGNGKYATTLKLPDVFGNYKLRTVLNQFEASGAGFVESNTIIPVRPFRQEEYERFILVAAP